MPADFRKYNRDLGILTRPHGLWDKRFGLGTGDGAISYTPGGSDLAWH